MDALDLAKNASQDIAAALAALTPTLADRDRSNALVAAGKILEFANYYKSAEAAYAEAHELNSGHLEALARLAIVRLKLGATTDALKTIGSLMEKNASYQFYTLDGKLTSAFTILGDAQRTSGNFNGAIDSYMRALAVVPTDGHAAGRFAELSICMGNIKAAQTVLAQIPDNHLFAHVRSTINLTKNDPDVLPAILGFREGVQLMSHV